MVCFETKPNSVQFCKNCGRYLGCFSCLSNLQDCPQCRKPLYKLNCPTCDSDIQQEIVPLFIPDLPTIPGLDDIPRPDIIRVPSNPWWCFLYMLYIDTLQKVPIVIVWYFCYGIGLLLLLSYGIISWKILFSSFMLLIWLVNQINRTLSVEE